MSRGKLQAPAWVVAVLLIPGLAAGLPVAETMSDAAIGLPSDPRVAAVSGPPWLAWRVEYVAGDVLLGGDGVVFDPTAIAVDSNDAPHIMYWGVVSGSAPMDHGASYATRTGLGWSTERIDSGGSAGDIALDGQDRPNVAYRATAGRLKYALRTVTGWQFEDLGVDAVGDTNIAVDSQGRVHIAYEGGVTPNRAVKYAIKEGGSWVKETIEFVDPVTLDVAVDSQGRAHVVYWFTNGMIGYSVRQGPGNWQVGRVGLCSWEPSIAIDAWDRPHIACRDQQGLKYVWNDGSEWLWEIVDDGTRDLIVRRPGNWVGLEPSIALDSSRQPHISYRNLYDLSWEDNPLVPGRLHYAARIAGTWTVEQVDRDGQNNGAGSSLALDSLGLPRIAYAYQNRWDTIFPSPPNTRFDLRYAEPIAATVTALAET